MENRTDYGRYIQEFILLVGVATILSLIMIVLIYHLVKSF